MFDGTAADTGKPDVFYFPAIAGIDRNGMGTPIDRAIAKFNVADIAERFRSDLQRGTVGKSGTVLHPDVFANPITCGNLSGGFDAKRIVAGLQKRIADQHVAAAVDVDGIAVAGPPVVFDAESFDLDAAASGQMQSPESTVFQRDAADMQIFDILKTRQLWTELMRVVEAQMFFAIPPVIGIIVKETQGVSGNDAVPGQ